MHNTSLLRIEFLLIVSTNQYSLEKKAHGTPVISIGTTVCAQYIEHMRYKNLTIMQNANLCLAFSEILIRFSSECSLARGLLMMTTIVQNTKALGKRISLSHRGHLCAYESFPFVCQSVSTNEPLSGRVAEPFPSGAKGPCGECKNVCFCP